MGMGIGWFMDHTHYGVKPNYYLSLVLLDWNTSNKGVVKHHEDDEDAVIDGKSNK